ncbi:RNA methyltransferase [Pseudanabaena sp. FACHB-2040]|uniref:TrmH family RNA methyltransferase n=1 Tax=Pseudanabaena sp. FACHB-2040 TaxID=2692859 RepID=UPI001682686B|nr:RNA methyltransferase [Pseudanabaena sp. FACHB-2040]MBD2258834.1 RNA methyltransferase [Pseudanabaena sp. FACHB-2040]
MLTSLQNSLVKHVRKLHQAKGRRAYGQFLLEGTHLVQEAWGTGYPLEVVCCTPAWESRYPDLQQTLAGYAARFERVSPEVLAAIATTVHPDGVVAVAPHRAPLAAAAAPTLGIAVETLQDPGNLGTLIRSASAVAADGLWLSADSVDPAHPKVLRASAGQWFRCPTTVSPDLAAQVNQWQQAGIQVLGTNAQAEVDYWAVDFHPPTVILLGNEGAGLSPILLEQVSQQVKIPLNPAVESLNVAIAGTLLLYEALRQRMGSGS